MGTERFKDKEDFLKGVADFMAHGDKLTTEKERLDDEIRAAGMDPQAHEARFRAFVEKGIQGVQRRPEPDAAARERGVGFGAWWEAWMTAAAGRKGWVTAAAMAALVLGVWVFKGDNAAMAAEVLAQGARSLANLSAIHLKARMRTLPRDNFEMIGLDYGFVEVDMWKRYGSTPQWRVEKPGRVVVMDGKAATLWIKPDKAARGGPDTGFVQWLKPLLDVQQVLQHEQRLAKTQGSRLSMRRTGSAGPGAAVQETLVVTVEAKAQGDYANDWLKNKSISDSDNRRVYRFDGRTQRLKGLEIYVRDGAREVLVFEITDIEYDPAIADGLFSLALPKGVIWMGEPKELADNDKYARMGPVETARAFFEACAGMDWDEVGKFTGSAADPRFRRIYGGLAVVQVGEAFKSGRYPGWFVPYEVRLKSGEVKKWNIAVRNDNPAKRFVVDGGI
ncbi:MAG: hypothetical protein HY748_00805 [Elusimicrobia bacterium]|nr:hypothetical protein [Elusimicrobiota bacterium]